MKFNWKTPSKTKEPENVDKAYEYAVFLLSLKLRTVGEVLKKMGQRGYSERVVSEVIERLKSQKYLDDRRYAEIFLENLKTYRTFGYYGIKKKFMEKKIPSHLIDSLLETGLSLEEEIKIAERVLKKEGYEIKTRKTDPGEVEYSFYGDSDQNKEKQKMAQRLKSRGFRSEVISRTLF